MKNENGFVLISVLVITVVTTLLSLSQINNNRLQERISGNQQKEINAHLAAEKGIFRAFEHIDEQNQLGTDSTTIKGQLTTLADDDNTYSYPFIALDVASGLFTLISKGEVHGATAYLKIQIEAKTSTGSSIFNDGVAGCEGVAIGRGGGEVDSYNSAAGDYGAPLAGGGVNVSNNGNVATINDDADVVLSGTGKVYGDITSNGDISTGTSSATNITGDITAVGDIQLKDIQTEGDIYAGGDLNFKALTTTGEDSVITVGNDINANGSNNIEASAQVTYGGENNSNLDFGDSTTGIVPPDINLGECDTIGITTVLTNIASDITSGGLATAVSPMISAPTGSAYKFSEDAVYVDGSATALGGVSSTTLASLEDVDGMGQLDEDTEVLIFDGAFDMEGKDIEIDGNVVLLITGDITTKNTNFTFTDPDHSSLTIITTGKVDINTNTDMFSDKTVNEDGEPPLTIYSSYESTSESDYALEISSNADMYTKLYAPFGNVELSGGADIMGAIRGSNVTVKSGTSIHFDEVLLDYNDSIGEEAIPASYSSVYYHYE